MKLIGGLGNPGEKYQQTRHNLGSLIVGNMAKRLYLRFKRDFFAKSKVVKYQNNSVEALLVMPMTYMNCSGRAVSYLSKKRKIASEDILIVCDDISLDFGKLRLRPNGSDGGHNGLKSVIGSLNTENFARLRVGIGPAPTADLAGFVLKEFKAVEKKQLDSVIGEATEACLCWLNSGISTAMNKYNATTETRKK